MTDSDRPELGDDSATRDGTKSAGSSSGGAGQESLLRAVFDPVFYLAQNPDVAALGTDPLEHYLSVGAQEGRNPHPLFDTRFYLESNPDVAREGLNPLFHYLSSGAGEGRDPHPLFDTRFYLESNPDVAREGLNPLVHYISAGAREARNPHPKFDALAYWAANPAVAETGTNPLIHFVTSPAYSPDKGAASLHLGSASPTPTSPVGERKGSEGPTGSPSSPTDFDEEWYLAAYPDVGQAVREGRILSGEQHYLIQGAREGRDPNAVFRESWYRREHAGVNRFIRNGQFSSGFDHYRATGRQEGLRPNDLIILDSWYSASHPGVLTDIADGKFPDAYDHYIRVGARRGYDPHPAFDERWYCRTNRDVEALVEKGVFISGYQHFWEVGLDEGRRPHPDWVEGFYLRTNPEAARDLASGRFSHPFRHLVMKGLEDGLLWREEAAGEGFAAAASRTAGCRLDVFLDSGQRLVFARPSEPEVSIVLVLHNRAELTFCCLESLLGLLGVSHEVILVDNASRDRTRTLLSRIDGARIILNDENRGFTEGSNQGAATASGEFLLFLNNDTEVFPGTVRSAVDRFRATSGAGAVGGRVIGLDGKVQEAGCVVWKNGTTCGYGVGDDPRSAAYRFPREVDYCSGVFLLTKTSTFERLGGFSEDFSPGYFEEVDYCFRLREYDKTVVYDPGSVLVHYGSASASEVKRSEWSEKNRRLFLRRHGSALDDALAPSMKNLFLASSRTRYRGRILYLDDRVPLDHLGSGFPRTRQILRLLTDMGYFVTLFAADVSSIDWSAAGRELPSERLEIVGDLGRERFLSFWRSRPGAYDVLLVSRWHNLRKLFDYGFDPTKESVRVIYDAEAITAKRLERRRQVVGADTPGEIAIGLEEELQLAARADEVWAVSDTEADLLRPTGLRISVVGHAVEAVASPPGFSARSGLLFVGRLREKWSPNVDALRWFFQQVLPRLEDRLKEELPCRVAGALGDDVSFEAPAQVRFYGRVADLEPLYASSRIFIAPLRFGAGIPLKILGAAAHGLPVVASSTLVEQLAWRDGDEILDGGESDPRQFAIQLARLYQDEDLWLRLQRRSIDAVRRQFDRDSLRRSLEAALDPAATKANN